MEDDPVNQKDDTDCQRDENSAALEGGQVQQRMGQEWNGQRGVVHGSLDSEWISKVKLY